MTAWGVEALAASALLMLAVLAVRPVVRRAVGPGAAYALWALPGLRLALPPMPDLWAAAPIMRVGGSVVLVVGPPAQGAATPAGWSAAGALPALWLAGALIFFVWHVVAYHRFRRRLLAGAVELERRGTVRVVESAAVAGPVALGLRPRYVAFPPDMDRRYDAAERELALAHELAHHARGDLLANWAALAVLAAHWFDPIAWAAFRAFRADQELACDARVLRARGRADRLAYASALVKTARGGGVAAACPLHAVHLKRRLRMLTRFPSRRRLALGAAAAPLLVAGGLALTASGAGAVRAGQEVPSASASPRQVRTVVVRPDGRGASTYLIEGQSVAPGAPPPGGAVLPRDFEGPADCASDPSAAPHAVVLRGVGGDQAYTVLCTRAPRGTAGAERGAYEQALESLLVLRRQVRSQVTPSFPEAERRRALAAVDHSIAEVEAELARAG